MHKLPTVQISVFLLTDKLTILPPSCGESNLFRHTRALLFSILLILVCYIQHCGSY